MNVLWYGTGAISRYLLPAVNHAYLHIVAFVDQYGEFPRSFEGRSVIRPSEINDYTYDYILVASRSAALIISRLVRDFGLPEENIVSLDFEGACFGNIQCAEHEDFESAVSVYLSARHGFAEAFSISKMRHFHEIMPKWHNWHIKNKALQEAVSECRQNSMPQNGKTVLFWQNGGGFGLWCIETYYALALQFRGYAPHFVLCDGTAPACLIRRSEKNCDIETWPQRCPGCIKKNKYLVERFGFSYTTIGELLAHENLNALYAEMPEHTNSIREFTCRGKKLDGDLLSGLIRYNKHADLSMLSQRHIKEFAYDAACNWLAMKEALRRIQPRSVLISNGIYTEFGPAYKAAVDNGIHVFGYGMADKVNCMVFSSLFKESSAGWIFDLTDEIWEEIKADQWDERYSAVMNRFYSERYGQGSSFTIQMADFLPDLQNDRNALMAHYGIVDNKPIFAFFTQIRWDASADYSHMIFESYDAYILAGIEAMKNNANVTWLFKVHPAEKGESPETRTEEFVRKHYPRLPDHIKFIPYDSPFSPLDFFNVIDGAVTACGTSGLEVASMGKPVITVARLLYSNRGFTYDSDNFEQFLHLISHAEMLTALTEEQKQLAQKYLVTYLYRQGIPIAPLSIISRDLSDIKDLPQLLPGRNKYIDLIMDSFEKKTSPLLPFDWL